MSAIVDLDDVVGEDAADMVIRTGDLRHIAQDPGEHICQMFRWSDVQALLQRAGGREIAASASNWASVGDPQALA